MNVSRYVVIYPRTKEPLATLHVVLHRDDVTAYLKGGDVPLAPRCPGDAHTRKGSWDPTAACTMCRGWGYRPRSENKAAEVDRALMDLPVAGTCPAIDDWRTRPGCIPQWLLDERAEERKRELERTSYVHTVGSAKERKGAHVGRRPGGGPRYRPRKKAARS